MTNNRNKGKVGERWFATKLRPFFPDIKRNQAEQADEGGRDLVNTPGFNFEVKYGKAYVSKMIRNIIDQTESEGKKGNTPVALIKPHKEKPYVVIPFDAFLKLLHLQTSKK